MGSPDKSNEKQKNSESGYKNRVIRKLEKEAQAYREASPSWIFINRLGGVLLDLLGWVLLIIALYLYIQSGRGESKTIMCQDISVAFCNSCYGQMQQIGGIESQGLDKLKGIMNYSVQEEVNTYKDRLKGIMNYSVQEEVNTYKDRLNNISILSK